MTDDIKLPHPVAHIMVGDDTEDVFTAEQLRTAILADRQRRGEPVAWSPALTYPDYEKNRVWANGAPRKEDIDYWTRQGYGITLAYTAPQPAEQWGEPVATGVQWQCGPQATGYGAAPQPAEREADRG